MPTTSIEPKQVLQRWIELFNAGDAFGLSCLYASDAINHQVMFDPVRGRDAIRERFAEEFDGTDMNCIVENMFQDRDWAIMEWRDPQGLRGCGFFQIPNGLIVFQRGYWDRLSFDEAFSTGAKKQ